MDYNVQAVDCWNQNRRTMQRRTFTTRIREKGMESGMYGQGFIYITSVFIKINIERFLSGCGTTKFLCLRGPLPESDMLEITWVSSGASPQGHIQRKRAVRYHTRLISEYFIWEAGRKDVSQSIIFKFFIHRSGVIPMGESRAGSGEQVK